MSKVISEKEFQDKLNELANKNWKVKNLLRDVGYESLSQNLKDSIDKMLGIKRESQILLMEE